MNFITDINYKIEHKQVNKNLWKFTKYSDGDIMTTKEPQVRPQSDCNLTLFCYIAS